MKERCHTAAIGLYATPKADVKAQFEGLRDTYMQKQALLEQNLKSLKPGSEGYKKCEKDLAKCIKKIKEYKQMIFVMETQMNSKTRARYC